MLAPRPLAVHLVGSWARPEWLSSPEIRDVFLAPSLFWRVPPDHLTSAQDDATRLAIYDQVRAGVDLLTDGEQRRQLFDRYFYARLAGVDADHPVRHRWGGPGTGRNEAWRQVAEEIRSQDGPPEMPSPQVVGPVEWPGPLAVADYRFLAREAPNGMPLKMTMSGPLTALNRLHDTYYRDRATLGHAIARALNREALALAEAGCRFIQLDEPEFRSAHLSDPELSRALINVTVEGLSELGVTVLSHICYGYANAVRQKTVNPEFPGALELMASTDVDAVSIEYAQPGHDPGVLRALGDKGVILGVINCSPDSPVETPADVASRLRGALKEVSPERLHASTDCGVWFLPRDKAWAKLLSLVRGTQMVRWELGLA